MIALLYDLTAKKQILHNIQKEPLSLPHTQTKYDIGGKKLARLKHLKKMLQWNTIQVSYQYNTAVQTVC